MIDQTRRTAAIIVATVVLAAFALAPTDASAQDGFADGDPATVDRYSGQDRFDLAASLTARRFSTEPAATMVIARGDVFADALAAAPLTRDGGLLLFRSRNEYPANLQDILDRYLTAGGTVYVMGGDAAISDAVVDVITGFGYPVRRLAGATRVGTAVAAAREMVARYGPPEEILLTRAFGTDTDPSAGWADAISAAAVANATGAPILLTGSDELDAEAASLIAETNPSRTILLGGTAALSETVADAVPSPTIRATGSDRAATATALATATTSLAGVSTVLLYPGFDRDGWARGLALSTIARTADGRLFPLGRDVLPDTVARWLIDNGGCDAEKILAAPDTEVAPSVVQDLLDLCG